MTNSFSKLKIFSSIGFNCYETIHTWNPSCTSASLDFVKSSVKGALWVYTPLYVLPHLVSRNFAPAALGASARNFLRSLLAVTGNTSLLILFSCALMKASGRVYYSSPFVSSILSHICSLGLERESRRNNLALFSTKAAFEILFQYLKSHGRTVGFCEDKAAVLLFAASIAVNFYLARVNGFSKDPLSQILAFLVGREEGIVGGGGKRKAQVEASDPMSGQMSMKEDEKAASSAPDQNGNHAPDDEDGVERLVTQGGPESEGLECGDGNSSKTGIRGAMVCPHPGPCVHYAVLGLVKPFLLGWLGQAVLVALRNRSWNVLAALSDENSLRSGLFLGGMSSIFKACQCGLRRLTGTNAESLALVSGFVSSLTMAIYPSTQLALYTFWKTLFTVYLLKFKGSKRAQNFLDVIFFISDSILINCSIMEPQLVARSYLKFVEGITDGKLRVLNVATYQQMTGNTNEWYYGDKVRDLKAEGLSSRYHELVGSWLLENKDTFYRATNSN